MKPLKILEHGKIQLTVLDCEDQPKRIEVTLTDDGKSLQFDPMEEQSWHCMVKIKDIARLIFTAGIIWGRRTAAEEIRKEFRKSGLGAVTRTITAPDDL